MKREPAVAGQFYPGTASALRGYIETVIDNKALKEKVIGIISPHAGYTYSGAVAGKVFSQIEIPDTTIMLGPNHTGRGPAFSLYRKGTWSTPLGETRIDEQLCDTLVEKCGLLRADESAHLYEHSLEVQLPFIQYLKKDAKIVPIILAHADLENYKLLAEAIAKTIKESKKNVLILASSDMTHYEPHDIVSEKDKIAIDAILKLDEGALLKKISELDISMCGYSAVIVMLASAKILGAKSAELIMYQTSAEVSGDYSAVVGYAGVIVK